MEGLRAKRTSYPDFKIILSVGGGEAGSEDFLRVADTPATRQAFAAEAVTFLRLYDVDGIDIDWESAWCYDGWDADKHASLIEVNRLQF